MVSIMKRFWLGLLIWCGVVCGQQSNTVYQVLFTNATGPKISSNITNIGQINHQATIVFGNAVGHTCVMDAGNLGVYGEFEYSYDNIVWQAFGEPTGISFGHTILLNGATWTASGTYPFVRFNLQQFDNIRCVATVTYSGSIQGVLSSQVEGKIPMDMPSSNTLRPVIVGGVGGFSGTTNQGSGIATPLVLCNHTISYKGVANNAWVPMLDLAGVNTYIRFCSLSINADGAGGTNVQLATTDSTNLTCANILFSWVNVTIGQYSLSSIGNSTGPALAQLSPANTGVCIKGSGAGNYTVIGSYAIVPIDFSFQ